MRSIPSIMRSIAGVLMKIFVSYLDTGEVLEERIVSAYKIYVKDKPGNYRPLIHLG